MDCTIEELEERIEELESKNYSLEERVDVLEEEVDLLKDAIINLGGKIVKPNKVDPLVKNQRKKTKRLEIMNHYS